MYRDARPLRPIFSIAAALFGLLASAAGSGVIAPVSPTSFIPGKAFDRFVVIWLENTVILPAVRGIFAEKYNRITALLYRTAIFKRWRKKALSSNDITVTTPIFLSSQRLISSPTALTHPSQPNYVASVGGDYFGLNMDTPINIPRYFLIIGRLKRVSVMFPQSSISWRRRAWRGGRISRACPTRDTLPKRGTTTCITGNTTPW
jgi:hypothetical protein